MAEIVLLLAISFLLSAASWILVFKKSARQKLQRGAWRFYGLKREDQREAYDALYLVVLLLWAVISSVFFFLTLVRAVTRDVVL